MVAGPLALAAAMASGLAALVHVSVVGPHLEESRLFAGALGAMAVAQAGWALLVLASPSPSVARAGAALNGAIVLVWGLSRTSGLPVGPHPWTPEAAGVLDLTATGSEAVAVYGALALARAGGTPGRAHRGARRVLLRAGAVLTVSGLGAALLPHPALHSPGVCCEPHLVGHLAAFVGMLTTLTGLLLVGLERPAGRRGALDPAPDRAANAGARERRSS
ncbi:MAG TPA: hypothetical protein VNO34_06295 [Actinomycetota bacterium]|nr:hypothetical protein [Actinomycetota bacterium]